ncbi:SDR family oxidoreductase [Lentibacter algarum]|uniref:SDR family oxidoreductase n=1 Tax=Lentibacter algarum TaxID=576131 RepID=UPI001C086814|nr:SDR family oxidoreductase [Lentibacter algarum]MBU2983335.1 SDR family oxidoreductase [Lentibacter algarum]
MSKNHPRLLSGVALVTGGSSGLGRALARKLASDGLTVAAIGRSEAAMKATAKGHDTLHSYVCDISDTRQLASTYEKIRAELGPISLLINNAAVYPRRDVMQESHESFMQAVAINLGGTFGATRHALDDMTQSGFGRILNIASFADIAPLPSSSAYSVSKGAARILTRALLADISDRFPDIVISDWLPGMLATDMGVPDGLAPEAAALWGAELACWHARSLNGSVFEMDCELPPAKSLKSRLKDRLLMQKTAIRRLGG